MKEKETKVKTSVFFTDAENKKIKMFCIENNLSLQEFIHNSTMYCLEKKVKPKE